jgi:hypothetical protein
LSLFPSLKVGIIFKHLNEDVDEIATLWRWERDRRERGGKEREANDNREKRKTLREREKFRLRGQ